MQLRPTHRAIHRVGCCHASHHHLAYTLSAAPGHDKPEHPETAARVLALPQPLDECGVSSHPRVRLLQPLPVAAPDSLQEVLQLVHPAAYLSRLQEICASLQGPTMIDDSTYISPGSFVGCCETAAAVLDVLDAVVLAPQQQQQQHPTMGFALVRPPGHHVKATRPMGFGLLNFIAVAARYALQQPHINKVLILDWDVHHGNGTEDIFYESDDVLYISTHQQGLWPYTGKLTSVGAGAGSGYTINIPLPGDAGHDSMAAVWQQVVMPAARRFQPDLILCSAGYDAHWADPLAGLQFEATTYHMLCHQAAELALELCNGRCIWMLEGGYHIPSLSSAVVQSFAGILGDSEGLVVPQGAPPQPQLREEPITKVQEVLKQVKKLHRL